MRSGGALGVMLALCLAISFGVRGYRTGFANGVAASQPELALYDEMIQRGCE